MQKSNAEDPMKYLQENPKKEDTFEPITGVLADEWEKAHKVGITDGSNPTETRVQMAVMNLRTLKLSLESKGKIIDVLK